MEAPDSVPDLNWRLNVLNAFESSSNSFFVISNLPSLAKLILPLGQKNAVFSLLLSQFVTVKGENDMTFADGSPGHLISISVTTEQLKRLNAPLDKGLDVVLVFTQQHGGAYAVAYGTPLGQMSNVKNSFQTMLTSVSFGSTGVSQSSEVPNSQQQTSKQTVIAKPNNEEPASNSGGPAISQTGILQFFASLSGSNEVPPVDSKASGTAHFSVNDGVLSYKIDTSGLDVVASHLQNAKEGSNGDVVAILVADNPAVGSINSAELEGPLKGKTINGLVDLMKHGKIYVNLHSQDFPSGEIRGTLKIQGFL